MLSNVGIRTLLEEKDGENRLIVKPLLSDDQIGEASLDIRLGTRFVVTKRTRFPMLDPRQPGIETHIPEYQEEIYVGYGQQFVLHPQEFALGCTLDYFKFPGTLSAYVIGRSSWGRLGLIIATATAVSPFYKGVLTLELANLGDVPIALYPCLRIAQLVFHEVKPPAERKSEMRYGLSVGPQFSKIHLDKELRYISAERPVVIIGLTGPLGAGKTTISHYLTEDKGFRYYSLASIVRDEARRRGRNETRLNLQEVGNWLREENGCGVLAVRMLKHLQSEMANSFIIDSIRHPAEIERLAKNPHFYLVGVEAPRKCRWNRLKNGSRPDGFPGTEEEFLDADTRDMGNPDLPYGQDIGGCLAKCRELVNEGRACLIDNPEGTAISQVYRKVNDFLDKIGYLRYWA